MTVVRVALEWRESEGMAMTIGELATLGTAIEMALADKNWRGFF